MADEHSPRTSLEVPSNNGSPYSPRRRSDDAGQRPDVAVDGRERGRTADQWRSRDPRSSSTQSLRPVESARDGRRTLLLIYIHGFLGNEMSFQSFPAHVHNLLGVLVAETHVLHTKIYPRYKSRKPIENARDDFSDWLEPNETPDTDVVLLGHSMGGILAAEVALLPPRSPAIGQPFRHRILGTIGFDTPYLGMHPGVIVSGIGSLFRPAPKPPTFNSAQSSTENAPSYPASPSQSTTSISTDGAPTTFTPLSPTSSDASSLSTIPSYDPNFDPPFPNDKHLVERKGWNSVLHFINKHSDSLTAATKQYFMSHLEFGGCLADYPGLRNRYGRIRALEDVDDISNQDGIDCRPPIRRVRFANYWTASTGIPKKQQVPPGQTIDKDGHLKPMEVEMKDTGLSDTSSRSRSLTPTPSISVEEYSDGSVTKHGGEEPKEPMEPLSAAIEAQMPTMGKKSGVRDDTPDELPEMQHVDSIPIDEDEDNVISTSAPGQEDTASESPMPQTPRAESDSSLPPLPLVPDEPQLVNLDTYTDKDARKIAEKEQKRLMKAYQQAVKDRETAIKDRRKLIEKREKKARQEQEKQLRAEQKQRLKDEKEEEKRQLTVNPSPPPPAQENPQSKTQKPKRDKKFCMLPPEEKGKMDKCWVRVYMEGVDEVGAHCGLFFSGPQYESLVGDVGARIEEWVRDDATRRMVLEVSAA